MDYVLTSISKYPKFHDYEVRLQTFSGWNSLKKPHDLATSGFFFIGGRDSVQCFHCGLILNTWSPFDEIDYRHEHSSPYCDFMQSKLKKNEKCSPSIIASIFIELKDIKGKIINLEKLINSKDSDSGGEHFMEYKLFS